MKAQTYRPRVQNGTVARRHSRAATNRVASRRASEKVAVRDGSPVLWTIIAIGTVIAAGFLLALQSQLNIYQMGQKDAELKAEFHDMANRQRVETLRQQQALNDAENAVLAQQNGLLQPKLSRTEPAKTVAAPSRNVLKKVVKTKKPSTAPRGRQVRR